MFWGKKEEKDPARIVGLDEIERVIAIFKQEFGDGGTQGSHVGWREVFKQCVRIEIKI